MRVTIEIPDDIAQALASKNGAHQDSPRSAASSAAAARAMLEMAAVEGYRSGKLTHAQVGRLLGIDYRFDVDAFLKDHKAYLDYTRVAAKPLVLASTRWERLASWAPQP